MGSLAVLGRRPRADLTDAQRGVLTDLAGLAAHSLAAGAAARPPGRQQPARVLRRAQANAASAQGGAGRSERPSPERPAPGELAHGDPLTGLGDRRAFDADLEALLAQLPPGDSAHLLLLDVNDFKTWNDAGGHLRGDALLREFARALSESFRPGDGVYRFGGDEFVVLAHGDAARPLTQELLGRAAQAERLTQARGFPGLSVAAGVASCPAEAQRPGDLLRLADGRMLREKAARRASQRLGRLGRVALDDRAAQRASEVALQALRFTLALLARDDDTGDAAWAALVGAAVASVPGAEGGSLYLREGDQFVLRAQMGFSDTLLGLTEPAAASQVWYGDPGGWHAGRARVIAGAEIERRNELTGSFGDTPLAQTYQQHGQITRLRASLCVPVVQGDGQVVAQLNLDSLTDEAAFGPEAAAVAEAFATQVAALLAARARQTREAARRRELEGLVAVNAALRTVRTPAEAELVLARQTALLLGTEHVVLLRYEAAEDALRAVAPGGVYARFQPDRLPRGSGLAWAALESGEVVRAADAQQDPRVYRPNDEPIGAVMAAPLRDGKGRALGALVVSRDHTGSFSDLDAQLLGAIASAGVTAIERALAARAETERAEEFRMLAELSALVSALEQPLAVAGRCLNTCRQFLGADFAAFSVPGRGLHLPVGTAPAGFEQAVQRHMQRPGEFLAGLGQARGVVATHAYPAQPYARPELVAAGVQAAVLAPVLQDGRVTGLVSLVWFSPLTALPPAAVALTTRAAELIGQALERRTHLEEVEATREGALRALGLALELRDFETAGHTERVVALCSRLGQAVGMSSSDLEGLRQGAYLHDIGKLAVPDGILLKPGKLDAPEWAVMQGHAAVGDDLTRSIPTLHPLAREVVRHHHERWDAAGYPDRLAGEAIPLAARVFSVVDVYDALTSPRPYKPAWSAEAALAEIAAQAGRQFDPQVVGVFLNLLAEMQAEGKAPAPEAPDSP
nr:HD domain-containing phosphohydrolase [Deinococcus budaensis]